MTSYRNTIAPVALLIAQTLSPAFATDGPPCNPQTLRSEQMFNCSMPENLDVLLEFQTASTYADANARAAFPVNWHQLGFDQPHEPVFPVASTAPEFLQDGVFWAAPLTGDEFLRLSDAIPSFPDDGTQSWGSAVAGTLGNLMGVSVVQGIVYASLSRNEVWAVDAQSGYPIWKADLISTAGNSQVVVEEMDGRPVVFVASGDANYNLENTIRFRNDLPHDRGAGFSSVYAFDGLTGEQLWRFDTMGASRPTPVYRNGTLYISNGDGHLYILNAADGSLISTFTNPGEGYSGLASPNWFETADGRLFIVYGVNRPGSIVAVDVTNPAAPVLGWSYIPVGATANSPGDTSVAIDPVNGVVLTNVFTTTATSGVFDLMVYAIDATTGALRWSASGGTGPSIPGFKGSVPMVHEDVVYMGNPLNETYRAYAIPTGALLWATSLQEPDDTANQRHRPHAAGVYIDGKVVHVEGRDIRTFDATTGVILNDFETPGTFSAFAINQPAVVGNMVYLGALSGWVFAAPLDYLMTSPGFGQRPFPPPHPIPPQQPTQLDVSALPTQKEAARFPASWLYYAGGQENNAFAVKGPRGVRWSTPLNDAIPLNAGPRNEAIFGTEIATHMTHLAFGVGTGVTPVNGIAYVGSDRFTINALNGVTGELIWRYRTVNANFGQPLVTPNTVVVSAGDLQFPLGATSAFKADSPNTQLGGGFEHVTGLDPDFGTEKWTFYTDGATSAMTPLYHAGNLYWIAGDGQLWAINADSGAPVPALMDDIGSPRIQLDGFNAISSANIYHRRGKRSAIMVVGKAMPDEFVGIDLGSGAVLWRQTLPGTYVTGFSAVSPAVDQHRGLVVSTVLIGPDTTDGITVLTAFALDASTGAIVWTRDLSSAEAPYGFVGPTPVIDNNSVFFNDALGQTVTALDVRSGAVEWQTPAPGEPGKPSWGPGVVVKHSRLIQPVGEDLLTFDARKGTLLNRYHVGGAFTYNHPTVVGDTLYIGNSWGWVLALPLDKVTGKRQHISGKDKNYFGSRHHQPPYFDARKGKLLNRFHEIWKRQRISGNR